MPVCVPRSDNRVTLDLLVFSTTLYILGDGYPRHGD